MWTKLPKGQHFRFFLPGVQAMLALHPGLMSTKQRGLQRHHSLLGGGQPMLQLLLAQA